jgi:hypothetical protein
MCWFFKRKKVEEYKCRHTWKDFPWYYNATYYRDTKTLKASIIAPYVCIHCKERTDRLLFEHESYYKSYDEANGYVTHFKEKYAEHMADRVVIEDMIADMQLVDREYLQIAEALLKIPQDKLFQPFQLKT